MHQGRVLAAVIVLATAMFAIGVSIERSDTHAEPAADESHAEGEEEEEELLGVHVESTPTVLLAVLVSLALAVIRSMRARLTPLPEP